MSTQTRKTHPMVLIAATAMTVFSILGSAMITGFIPNADSEKLSIARSSLNNIDSSDKAKSDEQNPSLEKNEASGKISRVGQAENSQTEHVASDISSCHDCGKIVSIKRITIDGEGSGLGAVAGGVTGGVIGNQIGEGQGNVLMTIIGVGGGAYAGHKIEKKVNAETAYVIKVKMGSGEYKTVKQHHEPAFAIGDAVKVKNGSLSST